MRCDMFSRWRVLAAVCAAVACWTVLPAFGETVKLTQLPGWDYSSSSAGGPFQANVNGLAGYSGPASFITFCVEDAETFSYGTTYASVISNKAVFGLNGTDSTNPSADVLSSQTAYLYAHYRAGNLQALLNAYDSDYDVLFPLTDLTTSNISGLYALQDAIWYLEGERATPYPTLAQDLVAMANAATNNGTNGQFYGVKVMQLWEYGGVANPDQYVGLQGHQHQDQLILVPLPPAFVAGLGLLGSIGLVAWGRRRSSQSGLERLALI